MQSARENRPARLPRDYNARGGTIILGGHVMPKYLVEACYTAEGFKNLQKDRAEGRVAAIKTALQSVGGKLETVYWTLGERDVILIAECPDVAAIASLSAAATASGMVRTKTTQLLSPAEVDDALQKAVKYRPPGQ